MVYGLYISAEGAQVQSQRLEVIANNLANVNTPGFKRDLAIFQARFAEETERGLDFPGSGTINDLGGGVEFLRTVTDFAPGPLERTDRPTDIAIDGDGFFQVRRGEQTLLTRAGNFSIQPNGELVTVQGYPVLSDTGDPVNVGNEGGPWRITPDGIVEQQRDRTILALVRPRSPGDLVKVGDNFFAPLAEVTAVEPPARRVQVGFIERSSVQPTQEMMQLIEASRVFEANTRLIQNQDTMLGTLISRVLRTA